MKYFPIFLLFSFIYVCYPQNDDYNSNLEIIFDGIYEDDNGEGQIVLSDYLHELRLNKKDLNKAKLNDLLVIPQIDFNSASKILEYKERTGNFLTLNELNNVDGLDEKTIKVINEYFYVKNDRINGIEKQSNNFFGRNNSLIINSSIIEDFEANKNENYQGSSIHLINKINLSLNDSVKFKFVTDKDKGEKSVIDHYSFGFEINGWMFFDRIVLGDYAMSFGQGLVFGNNFAISKSSNIIYSSKKHQGKLRLNSSTFEGNYFRGISTIINLNSFELQPFFSYSFFDANYDTSKTFITSILEGGYHRTETELSKKKNEKLIIFGSRLVYSLKNLELSFLYSNLHYSKELKSDYKYGLQGSDFEFYSLSLDFLLNGFNFYGEVALSGNSISTYIGYIGRITDHFVITSSIRSYPKDFVSPLSNSFGAISNKAQNEIGFLNGISIKTKILEVNTFFDIYKSQYPSATDLSIKSGKDFLIEFKLLKFEKNEIIFTYRKKVQTEEKTILNVDLKNSETLIEDKQIFRIDYIKNIIKDFTIHWRGELVRLNYSNILSNEKGILTFFDIKWRINKNFYIKNRLILFETDGYNSRIYEYESNISSYMYTQSLYGRGIRWYVYLNYDVMKYINLSLKFSKTIKNDVAYIDENYKLQYSDGENNLFFQINLKF